MSLPTENIPMEYDSDPEILMEYDSDPEIQSIQRTSSKFNSVISQFDKAETCLGVITPMRAKTRHHNSLELSRHQLNRLSPDEEAICDRLVYWHKNRGGEEDAYKQTGFGGVCVEDVISFMFDGDLSKNLFHGIFDMFVWELKTAACEKNMQRMYLPIMFQGAVTGRMPKTGAHLPHGYRTSFASSVQSFIPKDTSAIEQVYVPMYDNKNGYFFAVVIDIRQKKVSLLSTAETTVETIQSASSMVINASKLYADDERLGPLFENVTNFSFHIPTTRKQNNTNVSGIFVLKYMEANDEVDWTEIEITAAEIRVERMKMAASLVLSKYNRAENFGNKELLARCKTYMI